MAYKLNISQVAFSAKTQGPSHLLSIAFCMEGDHLVDRIVCLRSVQGQIHCGMWNLYEFQ